MKLKSRPLNFNPKLIGYSNIHEDNEDWTENPTYHINYRVYMYFSVSIFTILGHSIVCLENAGETYLRQTIIKQIGTS